MRRVRVEMFDDLLYAGDGTLDEAEVTITVGLNGKWVELDVSEASLSRIQDTMAPWMKAGHPPDQELELPVASKPGRKSTRGTHLSPGSMAWGRAIREFAQKHDFPYITKTGKYYYSKKLRVAYDEHLAETGEVS